MVIAFARKTHTDRTRVVWLRTRNLRQVRNEAARFILLKI